MICPIMKGRQYNSRGTCEGKYCGLWDNERNQCSIKTFLIPDSKNDIIPSESPSVEEMKESFMRAIKNGQIKGDG